VRIGCETVFGGGGISCARSHLPDASDDANISISLVTQLVLNLCEALQATCAMLLSALSCPRYQTNHSLPPFFHPSLRLGSHDACGSRKSDTTAHPRTPRSSGAAPCRANTASDIGLGQERRRAGYYGPPPCNMFKPNPYQRKVENHTIALQHWLKV